MNNLLLSSVIYASQTCLCKPNTISVQFSSPPEESWIHKPAHAHRTPTNVAEHFRSAEGYGINDSPKITSLFCEVNATGGGKLDLICCPRHLLWSQLSKLPQHFLCPPPQVDVSSAQQQRQSWEQHLGAVSPVHCSVSQLCLETHPGNSQ